MHSTDLVTTGLLLALICTMQVPSSAGPTTDGGPISFTHGPFAGKTVRVVADEIQKADAGRKCVDFVALVVHSGTDVCTVTGSHGRTNELLIHLPSFKCAFSRCMELGHRNSARRRSWDMSKWSYCRGQDQLAKSA